MSVIDQQLYRSLENGKQYDKLIPVFAGSRHDFDKESDNSNTYDTLRYMAQWANKYAYQMKKVAPLLRGRSTEETVNKIYKFLYSHFQYKLDGETQNLYSPSAAWHNRKTGFDCKTYSILASTILQNLSIPHAFRMVQQAGIMPGQWSHVYVIVPSMKSHFVIDGTTHTNREVSFTNKYDYNMKHRGLASPYIGALGCACSGEQIKSVGLGNPATLQATVKHFHIFLDELEQQGVSKEVTSRMLTIVRSNIESGIDPNMSEVLKKALDGGTGLGLLPMQTAGFSTKSFSLPKMTTSVPTKNYVVPKPTLPIKGLIKQQVTGGLANVSIGGISGGAVMSAITGDPLAIAGLALTVLKKIIPIEKTFGAVFANGFDLSCWGASYSEQKAKVDIIKDMPFMIDYSGIYNSPVTANLDKFQLATEAYLLDAINGQRSKYAKCTQKGHRLREQAIRELRKNTYEEFTSQGFILTPGGKKTEAFSIKGGLPGYAAGRDFNYPSVSYDSLTVLTPKQAQQEQSNTGQNPEQGNKSSSAPLLLGAGLLALKLFL